MPKIISVATVLPKFSFTQEKLRKPIRRAFANLEDVDALMSVLDNSGVRRRYFAFPPEYYLDGNDFKRRNDDYIKEAVRLCKVALSRALKSAGVQASKLSHIFFVTTTGLATPSIDAHIINEMNLSPAIKRSPIWGIGCAGGVVGIARANDYLQAYPDEIAALISVELCAQTFNLKDITKKNLVASAIFGDGCAATLLAGDKIKLKGVSIADTQSTLLPNSLEIMGWNFKNDGFELLLSPKIPALIKRKLKDAVEKFLAKNLLGIGDISHFILHPGGSKVLQAYQECLQLKNGKLDYSRNFLRDYGNLSSASVLFILKDALPSIRRAKKSHALMISVGPGFCIEQILLK